MSEGIIARITLWLEIYHGECEERDLLNDALEEIDRLRAALAESCDENRSVALAEPGRTATCPLEQELRGEIERLRAENETLRLTWSGDLGHCVYCMALLRPCDKANRDHWKTCEQHPARTEVERLRADYHDLQVKHTALVGRIHEFAQHIRGYCFWYESGRATQFIDDTSTAVLGLIEGPLKFEKVEVADE